MHVRINIKVTINIGAVRVIDIQLETLVQEQLWLESCSRRNQVFSALGTLMCGRQGEGIYILRGRT